MKTVIFNGSPRPDGDTVSLVRILTGSLTGDHLRVDAYRADISACLDCRWCQEHKGCKINDGMQEIYEYMKECDNILIASPIHFSELSGKLLALFSRLQAIYCARTFQNTELITKPKRGAILLVGGGDGRPDRACTTARILLHTMNCRSILEPVISHQTNERPAAEDAEAVRGVKKIVEFFNAAIISP